MSKNQLSDAQGLWLRVAGSYQARSVGWRVGPAGGMPARTAAVLVSLGLLVSRGPKVYITPAGELALREGVA